MATRTVTLRTPDGDRRVEIHDDGTVAVDGAAPVAATRRRDGAYQIGDAPVRVAWAVAAGDVVWVHLDGEVYRLDIAREGRRGRGAGPRGSLSAPMPATVVRVAVATGDIVTRGQTLIVLEAMKMELPVLAPADGRVARIHCAQGDLVQPTTVLIDLDEA